MISFAQPHSSAQLRKSIRYFGLTALLAVSAAIAQVASSASGIDASGDTQREKEACKNNLTQQDYATCMREAINAAAEKRNGKLENYGDQFQANALKRCDALKGEDHIACQARILGYGSTSGSIAGGGVMREVETVALPADAGTVIIEPKTSSGVVVLPTDARTVTREPNQSGGLVVLPADARTLTIESKASGGIVVKPAPK